MIYNLHFYRNLEYIYHFSKNLTMQIWIRTHSPANWTIPIFQVDDHIQNKYYTIVIFKLLIVKCKCRQVTLTASSGGHSLTSS